MQINDASSDEELMQAYQNGIDGAFDMLFRRYSPRVYGFLMNRVKDRTQVDDVFQATFLKLHQSKGRYEARFPFAPWLFTVCKNALIDHNRKVNRIREDGSEQQIVQAIDESPIETSSPLTSLDALPTAQRAAIELRYQNELEFEEIAERLKTSPLNARKLVSRGIQRLREKMGRREV